MTPAEEPIRFSASGRELAGILHHAREEGDKIGDASLTQAPVRIKPESPPEGSVPNFVPFFSAAVVVHPFAEEKKFSHRVLVELARELAGKGVATLRFDLSGAGDSAGESEDATLGAWLEDIRAARAELANRCPGAPMVLLGLRLGATLALAAAAETTEMGTVPEHQRGQSPFPSLVLWEPVLSGARYIDEILRRRMIKEMMTTGKKATGREQVLAQIEAAGLLDLDGNATGKRLIEEISTLDAAALAAKFSGRALLVQIAFNAKVSAALEALAATMRSAGAQAEARGIREQVIWDRVELVEATELIRATADWMCSL